ncbi:MAG: hypothetical protein RLZ94_738, partial [Actinomycetota bacterium]
MDHRRVAEEALHACLRLQRANLQWMAGLRTGALISLTILMGLGVGRIDVALSISIGLLFVSIADSPDSRGVRLRTMLWATLWISVGVLLGGLVSEYGVAHVAVALVIAAVCGYAGALGPRGALIGVLTLVLFALYAGGPVVMDVAVLDAAYFVIGGVITIVANLLLTPPRRLGAVRSGIAHAYRELQDAAQRRGLELAAPTVAAAVLSAHTLIDHEGCVGASNEWANRLLSHAERTRLAMLALISERSLDPAYVDELTSRLSAAAGAIADEIAAPLGLPGNRRRARARERLAALQDLAARAPDPRLATLAQDAAESIGSAVADLDSPWPLGSRAEIASPPRASEPAVPRLRAHLHWSDAVFEHAIRLTIAFGGATLASVIIDVPHAYWLPLTVAWIAKPDLANTVSRVTMRIAGTMVGLILVSAIVVIAGELPGEAIILSVTVGLAGALVLAYLNANYPLAVVGITGFVILIEYASGDGSADDIIARLLITALAGLWVLLVASVRPRRTGATAVTAMHATTDALRDYASIVRAGGDSTQARSRALKERTAALAAVTAATMETPGFWERDADRVDPVQAAAVITDIIGVASSILAEELLEERGQSDPALWDRIDAELSDLDMRVEA